MIVRNGMVIAAAGNPTLTDRDPTAHAEGPGDPRRRAKLGSESVSSLRPACHAQALRDVRGGDIVCADRGKSTMCADPKGSAIDGTTCSSLNHLKPAIIRPRSSGVWRSGSRSAAARLLRGTPLG